MRRTKQNVVPTTLKPQTIHNHAYGPSYAGLAIVIGLMVIAALPVLWWVGVFILKQAGFSHPPEALAQILLAIPLLLFITYVAERLFTRVIAMFLDNKRELKQLDLEIARHGFLTAQQPTNTSQMLSDNKRKAEIILAVMARAFDDYSTHDGPYPSNVSHRWWSRRKPTSIQLVDGSTVTTHEAEKVRGWVTEEFDFVRRDNLNIDRYPNLEAVRQKVQERYSVPVVFGTGGNYIEANFEHIPRSA